VTLGLFDPAFLGGLAAGGGGYDADAQAYITAVEAADGQLLEVGVKDAINAFFVGCKSDGIFGAIKASCILAGARTLSGALVPLVSTMSTPTNNGPFGAGDYDRKIGLLGNGSSKYLTMGSPTPLQNSAHQAIYLSSSVTAATPDYRTPIAQWPLSGTNGRTQISLTATDVFTRCRETTGSTINVSASSFLGISRSASASYTRRINSSSAGVSEASTGAPDSTLYIFVNPALGQHLASRLSFFSAGESLDLALLDARVSTLMSDLASAIP
jgi:hypothetical protein